MPKPCPVCHGTGRVEDAYALQLVDPRYLGADDSPTAKLPPIRETVRRRPPAPRVVELTSRVELVEALARELARELGELREDQADVDEDRRFWEEEADEARERGRRGAYGVTIPAGLCGAYWSDEGGEHMCRRPEGHDGGHQS